MKKALSLLLSLFLLLPLASCGRGEVQDDFVPPRAPEGFLDGYAEVSVSAADISVLADLFGDDLAKNITRFHGGGGKASTVLCLDAPSDRYLYFRKTDTATGTVMQSYQFEQDGSSSYLMSEVLKPEIDRNPQNYTLEFKDKGDLISNYTGEAAVGAVLDLIGSIEAGRKVDEDSLKSLLSFSADADDSVDLTGKVRTISATFTNEEIAKMLESESAAAELDAFFASFIDNYDKALSYKDEDKTTVEKIRIIGGFSLSLRMTVDARTGRVQLADITSRGADSMASAVYDGASGDVEISAEHVRNSKVNARYAVEHSDGRRAVEITSHIVANLDSYPAGYRTVEKEITLLETDGAVYFSSDSNVTDTFVESDGKKRVEESSSSNSIKYDSSTDTYTLTGGDIQLKLKVNNDALTGEAKNTKTGNTAELIFESEKTDAGRVHTLMKIKTSSGEKDISAAGVQFRYSNIGM